MQYNDSYLRKHNLKLSVIHNHGRNKDSEKGQEIEMLRMFPLISSRFSRNFSHYQRISVALTKSFTNKSKIEEYLH